MFACLPFAILAAIAIEAAIAALPRQQPHNPLLGCLPHVQGGIIGDDQRLVGEIWIDEIRIGGQQQPAICRLQIAGIEFGAKEAIRSTGCAQAENADQQQAHLSSPSPRPLDLHLAPTACRKQRCPEPCESAAR